MIKTQWLKRMIAASCGLLILFAQLPLTVAAEEPEPSTSTEETPEVSVQAVKDYESYLSYYRGVRTVDTVLTASPEVSGDVTVGTYEDLEGYVIAADTRTTFTFTVEKNGFYPLALEYYALPGKGMDIGIQVLIDGVLPFSEAAAISLNRRWADQIDTADGSFDVDLSGDQRIPSQTEISCWQSVRPFLTGVLSDEPMKVYLRTGEHTVTICGVQESCAVRNVTLGGVQTVPSYEQYLAAAGGVADSDAEVVLLEAEHTAFKSDNGLSPYSDRSTPGVTPNETDHVLLNAIGGYSWRESRQWLSWDFTVEHAGFYTLTLHNQQSEKRGMASYRTVYIDDVIPFTELSAVAFPYTRKWRYDTLCDAQGQPYRIWLDAGKHTLRMEACFGETASALSGLENSITRLNDIYRQIIVVTGASPDANRDYYLEQEIPTLLSELETVYTALCKQKEMFSALGADQGGDISYIQVLIDQLEMFLKDPSEIAPRLTTYRSNVTVLADILLSMKEQPLALDTILFTPADQAVVVKEAGFFETIAFRTALFFNSFFTDYSKLSGGGAGETIRVWISQNDIATAGVAVGRDQAQLIQKMVQSDFYAETGIHVDLSLVNSGASLIQAIVSGRSPDVVMFSGEGTPITLALRGAAEDLSVYEGFDTIYDRFYPSAFKSFEYGDGIYAVPDVQTFYVTFYRTDIFNEFGIEVPETWDEFYSLVKKLQRRNLSAGISGGDQNIFETLLFQNGSNLYRDDLSATCLVDTAALDTFNMWTQMYSHYGLDVAFDFLSRFRSGEMPIGVMPLTMYNTLVASAPEIDGLWAIAPIPGTPDANGEINRAASCAVTGTILLKNAQNKDSCFRFLDWWTSTEVQARFGVETEAAFGVANRYFAANKEAFHQLPWTPAETAVLDLQWSMVTDVAQTPASYYVSRCINNAFRNVVYYNKNPREIMTKYADQMDKELERKRREFGLVG